MKAHRIQAPEPRPSGSADEDFQKFEALRQGCMKGLPGAQSAFVTRYQWVVWRTVKAHMYHFAPESQDEVVWSTFRALLENQADALRRYVPLPGRPPEAYIGNQALFQVQNYRRRMNAHKVRSEILDGVDDRLRDRQPSPVPTPEEALIHEEDLHGLLERFKASLSPTLVMTFQMLYERELKAEDVARLMGCTPDVVYTRKRRILAALEKAMNGPSGSPSRDDDRSESAFPR